MIKKGERYGKLVVTAVAHGLDSRGWKEIRADVTCDCGTKKNVAGRTLNQKSSCGCARIKPPADPDSLKKCPGCHTQKHRFEYTKSKNTKDGLVHYCKACVHAKYEANKDDWIARVKNYQKEHEEETRASKRKWYRDHRESEIKKYHERSKDSEVLKRRRNSRVRSQGKRRAVILGADAAKITDKELSGILEAYEGRCWICQVEVGKPELHWDHYQPLSKGGTHTLDNLRPSCSFCNLSKHARWPITDMLLEDIRNESARRRSVA